MNRSPWGNPRKNGLMKDLQALAFWVVLIAVIGYLLFPGFFQDLVARLQLPSDSYAQTVQTAEEKTSTDQSLLSSNFPLVFQEVYGQDQTADLSKGLWAIIVRDGKFERMALTETAYSFVLGIIEKDRANGSQIVILSANGQVRQVLVSDEVFDILNQLAVIGGRNKSP